MNFDFELNDILDNYDNAVESKMTMINDYENAVKASIIDGTCENITKAVEDYADMVRSHTHFYNDYYAKWTRDKYKDKIKEAYNMFEKIAYYLSQMPGTTVSGSKIVFKPYGSLSMTAELLSKQFGFTSGMFTFGSSFTTHQAYTPLKWEFEIGLNDKRDGNLLIDFHLAELADRNYKYNFYC